MNIQHDTHPWTAYGIKEYGTDTILHRFDSRADAIRWASNNHHINDNNHPQYSAVFIRRTDIPPASYTPDHIIMLSGLYPTDGIYQYFVEKHYNNTAPLNVIVRPIMKTMHLTKQPANGTQTLSIEWHHPLPDIFPFYLLLRRTYTQIITPSTITLTATPKIGININWIKTISNGKIWDMSQIDDNRQHILDILDHTLTRSNTISQHDRMQYMRQLSRIIDPDICNIIGAHYTLD